MIDETFEELETAITKAEEALRRELAKIRTGRANADILDGVRVEYYGAQTPLKQMASISVPEPRLIVVKPFDKTVLGQIEKSIMQGQLGVNPSNDGEVIRIPMPPLTEQRRKELVKVARAKGEDCKVAIRKARHDAKDMFEALEKDGEIGQDEAERAKKKLDERVKAAGAQVDGIVGSKEQDILEV